MSAQRAKQMVETATWLRMNGDPEGARRLLQQALQLDPDNGAARALLASFPAAGPRGGAPAPLPPLERSTPTPLPQSPSIPPLPAVPSMAPRPGTPTPPPARVASAREPWPQPAAPSAPRPPVPPQESSARVGSAPSAWDAAPGARVVLDEPRPGAGASDPFRLVSEVRTPVPSGKTLSSGRETVDVLLRGVRDLLELDDHTGAMELLAKAEQQAPGHPQVRRMREESERVLMAMLESKLGDLQQRPRVRLKDDEIIWLNLDHRAGFVLAQIDGSVSYDDLFALSGMSRLDTARILAQLVQEGVIS